MTNDEPQGNGWFCTFTIAAYKPYFDVEVTHALKIAFIFEELCIGCGICVKVCNFTLISYLCLCLKVILYIDLDAFQIACFFLLVY